MPHTLAEKRAKYEVGDVFFWTSKTPWRNLEEIEGGGCFFWINGPCDQAGFNRLKAFEEMILSKRSEYQKIYMRNYRAKQRETRATAIPGNPLADIGVTGFTDRQLEQLRGIVRGELETLLTPIMARNVNTVGKPASKLTATNVNTVNRLCPQCGGAVTGQSTKVYCSDPCRKKAFSQRAKS